jgi:hypothetical protein
MADDRKHSAQRDEIMLYMDKSFQASIGYFAALLAFLTLSKTGYFSGITDTELLSIAALITSWSYLIMICSCLFAIQKRVSFILCTGPSLDYDWEVFSQDPSGFDIWKKERKISWKIDSIFVAPFLLVILCIAAYAAWTGFESTNRYVKVAIEVLVFLYTIPVWMMIRMLALNLQCSRIVNRTIFDSEGQLLKAKQSVPLSVETLDSDKAPRP